MKKILFIVVVSVVLLLSSCESPCERNDRIYGSEFYATYVYKFPEDRDLSKNVMVMSSNFDTVDFIPGYRPIPLHGGYYLDGPVPANFYAGEIYYLDFTYDELENGMVPDDWKEHWKEHIVDCWTPQNLYIPWEGHAWCRGYSHCRPVEPYSDLYNEGITLPTPIYVDVHVDTNILNRWIDNDSLDYHFIFGL